MKNDISLLTITFDAITGESNSEYGDSIKRENMRYDNEMNTITNNRHEELLREAENLKY